MNVDGCGGEGCDAGADDAPADDLPPLEIERRSFSIIARELAGRTFPPDAEPGVISVVKRVIHATADFDYAENLFFSAGAVAAARAALRTGAAIVTDTTMAAAGISKSAAAALGCRVHCFVADADVAALAKESGQTRSRTAVDKAADEFPDAVYVVGNAPTALLRIVSLAAAGTLRPRLVVGVPVGFVNVLESKSALLASALPCIAARGRKGGSTVAAAIVNALLYMECRP